MEIIVAVKLCNQFNDSILIFGLLYILIEKGKLVKLNKGKVVSHLKIRKKINEITNVKLH